MKTTVMLSDAMAPVVHLTTSRPTSVLENPMLALAFLVLIGVIVWWIKSMAPPRRAPQQRHFEETEHDGLFEISVPAPRPKTPYVILALLPAVATASAITALWIAGGHAFERSAWLWWGSLLATLPLLRLAIRNRDHRARCIQPGPFAVGPGMMRLPDGTALLIQGQFAVTRRNSARYGHSHTAIAHHVDLDYDGRTHILAGGMGDDQSMAVYHEVLRRLRAEP